MRNAMLTGSLVRPFARDVAVRDLVPSVPPVGPPRSAATKAFGESLSALIAAGRTSPPRRPCRSSRRGVVPPPAADRHDVDRRHAGGNDEALRCAGEREAPDGLGGCLGRTRSPDDGRGPDDDDPSVEVVEPGRVTDDIGDTKVYLGLIHHTDAAGPPFGSPDGLP
jgi:hypothetical protein